MGTVRTELMWQAVLDAVGVASSDVSQPLDVLDLGGGTGSDAVRLVQLGHRVTVVDPSPDALASLHRRAADAEIADAITAIQGDSEDLLEHLDARSYDLVICHGVLEHVDNIGNALAAAAAALRPGGHISVVVPGRNAAVIARALAGDFEGAHSLLTPPTDGWHVRAGPRQFVLAEIEDMLTEHGFAPIQSLGLRVFADLVPSAIVDGDSKARVALYDLERLVAHFEDFTAVSAGLQSIARLDLAAASPNPGGNSAAV